MLPTRLLRLLVACSVLHSSIQQWRDPSGSPTLSVSRNASGALRPGAALRLSCASAGLPAYTTLHWVRLQGNVMFYLEPRGHSPLELTVRAEPALHGAEFLCRAPYLDVAPNNASKMYQMFTVLSERVRLDVEGGTQTVIPDKPGSVQMSRGPGGALVCATRGLATAVVDVLLAKGNYEIQLHTGWQPRRVLQLRASGSERGARVYCVVTTLEPDDYRRLYALVSNSLPVAAPPPGRR